MIRPPVHRQAKILIVDDEIANVRLLEIILEEAGYGNVFSTTDARQAVPMFCGLNPDLVMLDLAMPHMDGFAVMRLLHSRMGSSGVPILVLTADVTQETRHRALLEGADDFLTKPLDELEVLLRIFHLLETRFQKCRLEQQVAERTRELEIAQLATLESLATASEYRDDVTGQHTRRVGIISSLIAEVLGRPRWEVEAIRRAAPLHDVGKIGVPDAILLKPGSLTPDEWNVMRQHTRIGGSILSGSDSPLLHLAQEIALTHHERWDGTGYDGTSGDDIPLSGRVVMVADVFDALTHHRPYKEASTVADAVAVIARGRGKQFDPAVVDAFLRLPHESLV